MGEEITFENGLISDFQGFVTLTLTLHRVTLHIFMHHSSTSTYTYRISLKSKKLSVDGRTYGRADGHLRPTILSRLGGVDQMINTVPKSKKNHIHFKIRSVRTIFSIRHSHSAITMS